MVLLEIVGLEAPSMMMPFPSPSNSIELLDIDP
jgi:hypothetical protein